MKAINTDIIGALIGFSVTALFWFNLGNVGMLSALFPKAIMYLMTAASLVMLVKGFWRPDIFAPFKGEKLGRIAVVASILFAWVFAMRLLGFIVSSILAFTALTLFLGNLNNRVSTKNVLIWVAVASIEVVLLYLVFTRILYVPLPKGMFI